MVKGLSAAMNPPNCDHCLRPAQTSRIAKELLEQRRPINLIGKPGQGRSRLLDDLTRIDPDTTLWLRADLKEHSYTFTGLLETLWHQTGSTDHPPDTLGGLVDKLTDDNRQVCLLLHNFDAILNNPDIGADFDVNFLDALNALKRNASLLCVTKENYNHYLMMTKAGERQVAILVLEPEALRPLSRTEVRSEIDRCLPDLGDKDADRLADAVLKHPRPPPFLEFVWRQIQDDDAAKRAFKKRLRLWEDDFKVQHGGGLAASDVAKLLDQIIFWYRVLRLDRIKLPLTGLLKQIERRFAEKDKGS